MIRLNISEKRRDDGSYDCTIYFSNKYLNINKFQMAYIYGILRSIGSSIYPITIDEEIMNSMNHICNYLNSISFGRESYVCSYSNHDLYPFDLTSIFKDAYDELYDRYSCLSCKYPEDLRDSIISFEEEINNKYDERYAEEFKSRIIINEENWEWLRKVMFKVSYFYMEMCQSGMIKIEDDLLLLDFIPKCFPHFNEYTLLNLAYVGQNVEFMDFLYENNYFNFNNIIEQFHIESRPDNKTIIIKHSMYNIMLDYLRSNAQSLKYYKLFRYHHFSKYEEIVKPNNRFGDSELKSILFDEYKMSILCNDIDNLNYLLQRFHKIIVNKLMYCENFLTLSDDQSIPECVKTETINFIHDRLDKTVLRKKALERIYERNKPWGYDVVTGCAINKSDLYV